MREINFCTNWNGKLNNKIFTTIRKFTEDKYKFYNKLYNQDVKIMLNKKLFKIMTFKGIYFIGYLSELSSVELMLDIGDIDRETNLNIFKRFGVKDNDKVMQLVFESKTTRSD